MPFWVAKNCYAFYHFQHFDLIKAFFVFLEADMTENNNTKLTREDSIAILQSKYALLKANGDDRYPKRSDFDEREVVAIKAFLGPWPRALEAAGIKPPRNDDRLEKNRQKRIRAKQRRIQAKKNAKKSDADEHVQN